MPGRSPRIHWQEEPPEPPAQQPPLAPEPQPAPSRPPTPLLDEIGRDLTALARRSALAPLFGRSRELRQVQRILLRKHKNNPLIVGAPGVGKTALVEGLAALLARGEGPAALHGLRIVELAPARLTAGTQYRGSFEGRMQQLIAEASGDPDLVLFVDEIHTLVRAGAVEGGALDAANMLKPALARGEIRCIGATTPDELERFLRADPAFERRFDPLQLDEPPPGEALEILAALQPGFEAHHGVTIDAEALQAAVELAQRYVPERRLPDKAIDLLDEACAAVRLPDEEGGSRRVDAASVARVLSEKLGLPVDKLRSDQQAHLAGLEGFLNERVIGQPFALGRVAAALRRAYSGLGSPERPLGVFAFFGGTGVGKTATARALAEFLFEAPDALIRLDMGEYNEAHTVARLFGAPPGYVGYTDEGAFASRLRRQPAAVVLLDECEKAHPAVWDAFLPVFDSGRFSDARGRRVEARQAIFILTSNLFTLAEYTAPESAEDYAAHAEGVRQQLAAFFRPEFVNRIDEVVLFGALGPAALARIAGREIEALNQRLAHYGVRVTAGPDSLHWLAGQAEDPGSGARGVQRLVARWVAEAVSAGIVAGEVRPGDRLQVVVQGGRLVCRQA